jgi:hypothetical protein
LRDGLLRTKAMNRATVKKLAESLEEACNQNGTLILGVAKRSKVLNYLSLAMSLEGTFQKDYPCFCEVPLELEKEAYNWARTWQEGDQVFGRMHFVKLVSGRRGLVMPVDVPVWMMNDNRRKEALEYLAATAESSFPVVGYPYPLVRAHDNAVLRGFEVEMFGSLLEKALISMHSEEEKAKVIELLRLGRGLEIGGWKEYGGTAG